MCQLCRHTATRAVHTTQSVLAINGIVPRTRIFRIDTSRARVEKGASAIADPDASSASSSSSSNRNARCRGDVARSRDSRSLAGAAVFFLALARGGIVRATSRRGVTRVITRGRGRTVFSRQRSRSGRGAPTRVRRARTRGRRARS